MKVLASFLAVLIAFHAACMTQCVAEGSHDAQRTSASPCPDHQNNNDNDPSSTTCSEGFALEAKTSPVVKCDLSAATIPCVVALVTPSAAAAWQEAWMINGDPIFSPAVPLSARRI